MELVIYNERPDVKEYSKELLTRLYTDMRKERMFDQSVIRMVSEGKIAGFYHPGSGQEAIAAGVCANLTDEDYLLYMHRGCNEMICKGMEMDKLYADFFGNIHGTNRGLGAGIIHGADPSRGVMGQPGTVGSNMPIAVGLGVSIKYRKTNQVVYCTFGDGTANRELLHGAFNYAALMKLPVIFLCQNNEYGLGAHYKDEHATTTGYIAERGLSYGIPSYVVDGNNVLAVYEVAKKAVENARGGGGPSFIEAKTYRQHGHFIGDPATYMDKERLRWFIEENDPLDNYDKVLLKSGMFTEDELKTLVDEVTKLNDEAIVEADSYPLPTEERLYQGLYSTSPSPLE